MHFLSTDFNYLWFLLIAGLSVDGLSSQIPWHIEEKAILETNGRVLHL